MTIRFRQGIVPAFRSPAYFDIVAREVQGALDADLKRPYFLDNSLGGNQLLIEIQLSDGDVMEALGPVSAPDLRLELRLRAGAGRPGAGAVRPRHLVHAPRAGADRASRRRRRRPGQGPRRARLRLLRRHARGAQRRHRLPDHAHPPAALDPAAHRDAGRRQPRPAHAAHPHEAVAGDAAGLARDQGARRRRGRHAAHDRGLSRLRPRRGRRGSDPVGPFRDPRGRGGRRPARQRRYLGRAGRAT